MERPQCHSLALLTYEIQFLNSCCMLKYVAQEWPSSTRIEVDALATESYSGSLLNSRNCCMMIQKYVAQEWHSSTRNEVDALAPESHRLSGMRQPWESWSQAQQDSWSPQD